MKQLRIGSGSEYVLFQLPSNEILDDWYYMDVNVAVSDFNGSVKAYLESIDFKRFEQQLQVLYDTLQGTAELRPIEKQVVVVLTGNGRGGIEVTGELSSLTRQNKLEYCFEIDQTFIVETLHQLAELNW